jgi:hypothetical protein
MNERAPDTACGPGLLSSRGSKKRLNDGPKGRKTMRQLMQGMEESFGALIALLQLLDDGKIEREAEPKRQVEMGD